MNQKYIVLPCSSSFLSCSPPIISHHLLSSQACWQPFPPPLYPCPPQPPNSPLSATIPISTHRCAASLLPCILVVEADHCTWTASSLNYVLLASNIFGKTPCRFSLPKSAQWGTLFPIDHVYSGPFGFVDHLPYRPSGRSGRASYHLISVTSFVCVTEWHKELAAWTDPSAHHCFVSSSLLYLFLDKKQSPRGNIRSSKFHHTIFTLKLV